LNSDEKTNTKCDKTFFLPLIIICRLKMASAANDVVNVDVSSEVNGDNDTCLQLALEGEKLCKAGNCRDGVAFFEAALQVNIISRSRSCHAGRV
jgi:hypothetical protein